MKLILMGLTRWGFALGLIHVSANLHSPLFLKFKIFSILSILSACVMLAGSVFFMIRQKKFARVMVIEGILFIVILTGIGLYAVRNELFFHYQQYKVLQAPVKKLQYFGRHIIVGYRDYSRVKQLVSKGAVGGIYITARNISGTSAAQIREEIQSLQKIQKSLGLPPLLIAADQEGGSVSRLSPPLPPQPSLSAVIGQCRDLTELNDAVIRYAEKQARGLADLGVNVNLSPVADLKNKHTDNPLNIKSQIYTRAISDDPEIAARVVSLYCRVMEKYNVKPTLKHFPGLGRVREETHLIPGVLDTRVRDLEENDWIPFKKAVRETGAFMMLGHVKLNRVDPDMPVSFSEKVIQTIIRENWQHDGILITDDLNMGPVYGSQWGIGRAAVKALNAGVDLLLISYDGDQYFKVMDAILQADKAGKFNLKRIAESRSRLERL